MKLSLLSILLGVGVCLPQIYGLAKPEGLAGALRKFPRDLRSGVVLMLLGTAWFLWMVYKEPVADFAVFKPYLMILFAAVGILSCVFIQDFLAVRGLAVVLLLLGKLMVDIGRPHLGETAWVLLIQTWAYVLIIAGIWFTVTPWKLRDMIEWRTATKMRLWLGCVIKLAFGIFMVHLGLTAFRGM